jgi:hypothetical protein
MDAMDRKKTIRDRVADIPADEAERLDDSVAVAPPTQPSGHESATGDDETADGLNETDEAVRRGAEDIPAREHNRRLPVFERGEEEPETD